MVETVTIRYLNAGERLPYCPAYTGISREQACQVLPELRSRYPRGRFSISTDQPPEPPAARGKWRLLIHLGGAR